MEMQTIGTVVFIVQVQLQHRDGHNRHSGLYIYHPTVLPRRHSPSRTQPITENMPRSTLTLVLIFATLVALLPSGWALKKTAECDLKATVKKCIKSGFLLESIDKKEARLPSTIEQVNELCGRVDSGEQCAKNFIEQCSETSKEKRALDHSLEGAIRLVKRICKTNTKKSGRFSGIWPRLRSL